MVRRIAAISALCLIGGVIVVALVHAQEFVPDEPGRISDDTATAKTPLADRLKAIRRRADANRSADAGREPLSEGRDGSDISALGVIQTGGEQPPPIARYAEPTAPTAGGTGGAFVADPGRPSSASPPLRLARPPAELGDSSRRGIGDFGNAHTNEADAETIENDRLLSSRQPRANTASRLDESVQSPSLQVSVEGPKEVVLGQEVVYTFTVANTDERLAHELAVAVRVPDSVTVVASKASAGSAEQRPGVQGAQQLIWNVGGLPSRGRQQLQLTVVPKEAVPIEFTADVVYRPAQLVARVDVQQPRLELAISGPSDLKFGEKQKFRISLANPGSGPARNVSVRLWPLTPEGAADPPQQIGDIPAGQQTEIDIEIAARQSGALQLRIEATADGGLRAEAVKAISVRQARLAVKVLGPPIKYAGTTATYKIQISNAGDADADDVLAACVLPPGIEYVGGLDGASQVTGGLRWSVGRIPAGGERVFQVQCEMKTSGETRFEVGAQTADGLEAADAVITRVESIADLKLFVDDPKGPKAVGESIEYEITIVNRGTNAATNANVVIQFSEGIEPTSGAGHQAEVLTGQVVFAPIPRIAAGEQLKLKVAAKAEKAGNHIYRVELTCSQPETRRVHEGNTRFFSTGPIGK